MCKLMSLLNDASCFGGDSIQTICYALKCCLDGLTDSFLIKVVPALAAVLGSTGPNDSIAVISLLYDIIENILDEMDDILPAYLVFTNIRILPEIAFCVSETLKLPLRQVASKLCLVLDKCFLGQDERFPGEKDGNYRLETNLTCSFHDFYQNILLMLWRDPDKAQQWLLSLIDYSENAGVAFPLEEAVSRVASRKEIDDHQNNLMYIVLSLAYHCNHFVQTASLQAFKAISIQSPVTAISGLPIVLHRIQELSCDGQRWHDKSLRDKILLELMYDLALFARNASGVPFVIRSLQPLLSESSPIVLQSMALRIIANIWTDTGHGYHALRSALLSYSNAFHPSDNSMDSKSLMTPECLASSKYCKHFPLRISVAATLHDICTTDAGRASEFIGMIYLALKDFEPRVHSIALHTIAELCEQDALDFYASWHVIRKTFPTIPTDSASAVAWLRLLATSHLDSQAHPEICSKVLDAIWYATLSEDPLIRMQAYGSLTNFDFNVLEKMDLLGPLWEYADLLSREGKIEGQNETACRIACEKLVMKIFVYEYSSKASRPLSSAAHDVKLASCEVTSAGRIRERTKVLSWSSAFKEGNVNMGKLTHKLVYSIPKLLLENTSWDMSTSKFITIIPDLCPASVLYLWDPPMSDIKAAARSGGFQHVFEAITNLPVSIEGSIKMTLLNGPSIESELRAWSFFLDRWIATIQADICDADPSEIEMKAMERAAEAVLPCLSSEFESFDLNRSCKAAFAIAALVEYCEKQHVDMGNIVRTSYELLIKFVEGCVYAKDQNPKNRTCQAAEVIQGAAAIGLGYMFSAVRKYIGMLAARRVIEILIGELRCGSFTTVNSFEVPSVSLQIGCAVGVGFACKQLAFMHETFEGGRELISTVIQELMNVSNVFHFCKKEVALMQKLTESGIVFSEPLDSNAVHFEVREAATNGLSTCIHSFEALEQGHEIYSLLATSLLQQIEDGDSSRSIALLLSNVAIAGYRSGCISDKDLSIIIFHLKDNLSKSQGKQIAIISETLGRIVADASKQGFPFCSFSCSATPKECVDLFIEILPMVHSLQSCNTAKKGILRGLAAFIIDLKSFEPNILTKDVLQVLKRFATGSQDKDIQNAASWLLSDVCCQARIMAQVGIEGDATLYGMNSRHVSWHIDGAMRYVVDALVACQWPEDESLSNLDEESKRNETEEDDLWLPSDTPKSDTHSQEKMKDGSQITCIQICSLLKILSSSKHVPALNWTAVLRKILRLYPDCLVKRNCFEFVVSHAKYSEMYQLRNFVEFDILEMKQLKKLDLESKVVVFRNLKVFINILPAYDGVLLLEYLGNYMLSLISDWKESKAEPNMETSMEPACKPATSCQDLLNACFQGFGEIMTGEEASLSRIAADYFFMKAMPLLGKPPLELIGITHIAIEKGLQNSSISSVWTTILKYTRSADCDTMHHLLNRNNNEFSRAPLLWTWIAANVLASRTDFGLECFQSVRSAFMSDRIFLEESTQDMASIMVARALATQSANVSVSSKYQWVFDVVVACENNPNRPGMFKLSVVSTIAFSLAVCFPVPAPQSILLSYPLALELLPKCLSALAMHSRDSYIPLIASIIRIFLRSDGLTPSQAGIHHEVVRKCAIALRHALKRSLWCDLFMDTLVPSSQSM